VGWKPVTFSDMKKQPDKTPIKSWRDAYKVSGFRVQARIDSYDELLHGVPIEMHPSRHIRDRHRAA
jgi:hypothetical protein